MKTAPLKTDIKVRQWAASIMAGCALGESLERIASKLVRFQDARDRYVGTRPISHWEKEIVEAIGKRLARDVVKAMQESSDRAKDAL